MFCMQCEQTVNTAAARGCTHSRGMCGKTAQTADLQDLLIAVLQGLSAWVIEARRYGYNTREIDLFAPKALFSTLTNVNFDPLRIIDYAHQAVRYRQQLKSALGADASCAHPMAEITLFSRDPQQLQQQAYAWRLNRNEEDADIFGLRLLCLYGLKGTAAYIEHARVHGRFDEEIWRQYHDIMAWLGTWPQQQEALLDTAMAIGKMNFAVMALLDEAQTGVFGHPVPASVNTRPVAGKAILISGHDLKDLQLLLKQTAGSGINIYTHGEMLPAHGYPLLKKYPHLAGNYGSGWQNQQEEFARFPGPIVMTSNCIINPAVGNYQHRIWTRSIVAWPGVKHLDTPDFSAVIDQANSMAGFPHDEIPHSITVGFGRETLLGAADTLLELVGQKKIRHVFLIGGCDGNRKQRGYFTELACAVPKDCLILTLACGKYRFNKLDFGSLAGLPRLMDIGQCNDSYAAVMLAVKLAEKLGCDVNELPLSLVLSWFEQKAIAVLLTLLALGVKNIRIGPTLPAFLSDRVLALLQHRYGLRPVTTPENDLAEMLMKP